MSMSRRFELTVVYEQVEGGRVQATVPALPGTISVGKTRAEARAGAVDALAEMLGAPPVKQPATFEKVRVRLEADARELGRGL